MKVKFTNQLDENTRLPLLQSEKRIIIDFKPLEMINSTGIREWLVWVATFSKDTVQEYHHCPSILVEQFNLVNGFLPDASFVKSLYIPYFCEDCNSSHNIFLELDETFNISNIMEFSPCPSCNKKSEIDIIPEKYFAFHSKK